MNTAPIITAASSLLVDEDKISPAIPFEASDVDGDALILTLGSATSGVVTDLGDGTYTYAPNANFNGSDSFTISVTDGLVTVEQPVSVTVNPVNDSPTGDLVYHGKFVEGQTVSVDATQIRDVDGLGEFSYRWSRDGQLVSDIDSPYYIIAAADLSSSFTGSVSYLDADGTIETVVGSPLTENTLLGDFRSLSFDFIETNEQLRLNAEVELSETFSEATYMQLLYWEVGGAQTWINLTRELGDESFTYSEPVNRFLSSGIYEIRSLRAWDNFGAEVSFSHEKLQELGVNTQIELVNSQSDERGPVIEQFSISEFYYNERDETWDIDYTIRVSDDLSGVDSDHAIEFTGPMGTLMEPRSLEPHGSLDSSLTVTLFFNKHLASGDYKIADIRLNDLAGNNGDDVERDLLSLGAPSILTLDNPFQDADLPELLEFSMEASFHPVTLRPTILFDFVAQDSGTGYDNTYIRISDSNGLDSGGWVDYDRDTLEPGIQFLVDLTAEYTPGTYTIDWIQIHDVAGNESEFSAADLEAAGYDSQLNVFFKPLNAANDFVITATDNDDWLIGSQESDSFDAGSGDDVILSLGSSNLIKAGGGSDSISLVAESVWGVGYYANHASSIDSIGTGKNVSLNGKSRFADIIDGGSSNDIVYLTSNADAFFLDDHFSQVHPEAVANAGDYQERFTSIEKILGGSGDDILDCSSENYLLNQLHMELDGGSGNDILWAAQGDDTLNGGTGNDILNGSSGNDTLTGGSGADIFEFTATSGNDTITDFNKDEDELHFYYRKGEAEESAVASIENGVVTWDAVTIDLGDPSLIFSDLNIAYEMV